MNELRKQFEKETEVSYNDYFQNTVYYSDKYVEWLENRIIGLESELAVFQIELEGNL